jgi:hypothetical protein
LAVFVPQHFSQHFLLIIRALAGQGKIMQEYQFIWEHFKFNADQRLKSFNFFVLLSIFADGGVFTALEKNMAPQVLTLMGAFISLLSVVFWLVDSRSQNLLKLTIPALKEIESSFGEKSQLFRIDSLEQGKFVRYTFAIRTLLFCQFSLGIGVVIYGIKQWFC